MEILHIDIGGKFAHFRKYYANNTAMSYSIPPRTTVMGMLAALLGWERDSYYEDLASDHIRIGIQILTPLKKTFHRLNLLKIKSNDDFSGKGGPIQTPFEVVSGYDLTKDWVSYRFYISPVNADNQTFVELKKTLLERKQKFNLTLGAANFTASIFDFEIHPNVVEQRSDSWISVHSAVPSDAIVTLDFEKNASDGLNFIEEELLPADFKGNYNREVSKMIRTVYSTRNLPFEVELQIPYCTLVVAGETQNIVFLE